MSLQNNHLYKKSLPLIEKIRSQPLMVAITIGAMMLLIALLIVLSRRDTPTPQRQEIQNLAELKADENCLTLEMLKRYEETNLEDPQEIEKLASLTQDNEEKRQKLYASYGFVNAQAVNLALSEVQDRQAYDEYLAQSLLDKCLESEEDLKQFGL